MGSIWHSADLSWVAPTTDADGGPLTGLAGYRIYWGQNPLLLTLAFTTGVQTSQHIETFPSYGRWYFDITAFDPNGNEGPHSAMVSKLIVDDGPVGGFSA